ncbi:lambda tail assembly I, partial [Escherichia coli O104:H4 str. 01-09591]
AGTESQNSPSHRQRITGKQNTYFSSLDNMVAQGNVLPVLYGEMRVGSRVVSQEIRHGRRRGRWSGCGDWSLMQNVLCETACGRFCHLWSVRNG